MGSAGVLSGALRVNVLIRRGLREKAELEPLRPRLRHPVSVRALFGVCPVVVRGPRCYPCGETPTQVRCGIRPRQSGRDTAGAASPDDVRGGPIWGESVEGARLGRNGCGLHTKGYISDSKSKTRSVVVTAKGVQRSRELFEKHFGKKEP